MKKINYISTILLIICNSLFANSNVISGKIIDIVTGKGIPNVHIYSAKLGEGTITNTDGNFYLIVANKDELHISCIGYKKQIIKLSDNEPKIIIIKLEVLVENLDEIVINAKAITVNEILDKVFKNFKKNHLVAPVYYKFYNRLVNYSLDSTLISIEEYSGSIKQNWMHSTKYHIEKGRIKYLTKDSIEQLKNHRVIAMDKMYIDNIYKYREDYLKKKGKRMYEYTLLKKSSVLDRDCYVIAFNTDKSTHYKKGELYIDMQDFAIVRKTLVDSNNEILNDITFKKEKNNKWCLKKAEDYHLYSNPSLTEHRITLYNYLDIKDSNLKYISLSPRDFSFEFSGNFNDKFWKNSNFIPLPNWIDRQMK